MKKKDLMQLIRRNLLSSGAIVSALLDLASIEEESLADVVASIETDELARVYSALESYPCTDIGWSILPLSRKPYVNLELSSRELGDLRHRQYQEDREGIELLRKMVQAILDSQYSDG